MRSTDIDRAIRDGLDGWAWDELAHRAWQLETETELVWGRLSASAWLGTSRSCSYFVDAEPQVRVRLPGGGSKSLTFSSSGLGR